MREVKFRGFSRVFGSWLYGSLVKVEESFYICGGSDMEKDGHHIRQVTDIPLWVEPKSVGQCVGLHDKNGKEIYEGDIVKTQFSESPFGVVTWHTDGYFFIDDTFGEWEKYRSQCLPLGELMKKSIGEKKVELEIIGNKYEKK